MGGMKQESLEKGVGSFRNPGKNNMSSKYPLGRKACF